MHLAFLVVKVSLLVTISDILTGHIKYCQCVNEHVFFIHDIALPKQAFDMTHIHKSNRAIQCILVYVGQYGDKVDNGIYQQFPYDQI